jgi:hypothetical protein
MARHRHRGRLAGLLSLVLLGLAGRTAVHGGKEVAMVVRRHRGGLSWLLSLVLLGLAVGVPAWLLLHEDYAIGWVVQTQPVPGDRLLARVETPWTPSRWLLCPPGVAADPLAGRWLAARGTPRVVGQWSLLVVDTMRTLPHWLSVLKAPDTEGMGRLVSALAQHRGLAAVLGAAVLLLGFVFLRLAASKVGGILGALVAWHAAVVAACEGLLLLPEESALLVLLLGFAVGALLGGRRDNLLGYLAQRLALIVLFLVCAEQMAHQFAWPVGLTQAVALLGTLVSPVIGLWLLGAYLLAVGLGASGAGSYVVLGATAVVIHTLVRGEWVPGWHPRGLLARLLRRRQPRRDGPEVQLDELVQA